MLREKATAGKGCREIPSFKSWVMITSKREPGVIIFARRKIKGKKDPRS